MKHIKPQFLNISLGGVNGVYKRGGAYYCPLKYYSITFLGIVIRLAWQILILLECVPLGQRHNPGYPRLVFPHIVAAICICLQGKKQEYTERRDKISQSSWSVNILSSWVLNNCATGFQVFLRKPFKHHLSVQDFPVILAGYIHTGQRLLYLSGPFREGSTIF